MKRLLLILLLSQSIGLFAFSFAPADSCTTPVNYLCTQPVVLNIICPDFCLEGDYTIVSAHALFDCSITLMETCIRYIALPGFIATDTVEVVACNETVCDTALLVIHVVGTPDLCLIDPPPLPECESSPSSLCTVWNQNTEICPDFCFTVPYEITAVNSVHSSEIMVNGPCFSYSPFTETVSWDVLTVIGCDFSGNCDTLEIYVTLGDCNAPPVPSPEQICTEIFTPIDLCFEMEAGEIFSASDITTTFECSITAFAQSCITYYPLPGFSGADTINIPICQIDNPENCRNQQFVVFVGCQVPSVVTDIAYISPDWVSINGQISSDENGYDGIVLSPLQNDNFNCLSPLSLNIADLPQHGILNVLPGLLIEYIPNEGFYGTENISLQICNLCGQCSGSELTVFIAPQNNTGTTGIEQTVGNQIDLPKILEVNSSLNDSHLSVIVLLPVDVTANLTLTATNGQTVAGVKLPPYSVEQRELKLPVYKISTGLYVLTLATANGKISRKIWLD